MGTNRGGFWVGGLVWLLGGFASGCGEGPGLRFEEFYTSNGEETRVGEGCVPTEDGMTGSSATGVAGSGGSAMQPYTIEYLGKGEGITVTVIDGTGTVRTRREFDEAFLEAGKSDEIVVDLAMDTLRLHYVGAKSCDPG